VKQLVRLHLRRDRWQLLAWVLFVGLLPTLMAVSTRQGYPDQATMDAFAQQSMANASEVALRGPVFAVSVGGLVAWTVASSGSLVSAVIAVLMAVRYVRSDEAAGRKWLERAIASGSIDAMNEYGLWLHNAGKDAADRARGVQLARQAVEKDDAGALNNLAWMLCTSTHDDVRKPADGMTYVARLEKMPDLTPGTVDTLAACYAAVGQYPRAVELQQQVIADMRKRPAPALANIKEMEARLALYRAGKPYIEVPAKR